MFSLENRPPWLPPYCVNAMNRLLENLISVVPQFPQRADPLVTKDRLDSLAPSLQRSLINQIARTICDKHVFSCVPLVNEHVRVSRNLIEQCDQLQLPLKFAREIKYAVFDTLRKIVVWIRYATERIGMDLERTLKDITWNVYGRIETEQILHKWLADRDVQLMAKFKIAAEVCSMEAAEIWLFLWRNVPHILIDLKKSLLCAGEGKNYNKFAKFNMLALYAMAAVEEDWMPEADRVLRINDFDCVNLFFDCLRFGNIIGMEWFWMGIHPAKRRAILPALGEFLDCPARNGFSVSFDKQVILEIEQLVGRVDYSDAICEFYHTILGDEERKLVLNRNPPFERLKGYEDATERFLILGEKMQGAAFLMEELEENDEESDGESDGEYEQ